MECIQCSKYLLEREDLVYLGILNNLEWYRCMHCGNEFSKKVGDNG
jgi:DNA-directed RNA polymerase subunit RPC12/RpoP